MPRISKKCVLHPTAATFDADVLSSSQTVVVDFWAAWCPPCRVFKPELERLALELVGRARVAFVNVDEEPELARRFNVSGIPAIMIVKSGKIVDAWTGAASRIVLLARLEPWVEPETT